VSSVTKRSLSIRGHSTSISLEDAFFEELNRIAAERSLSFAALVAEIDERRDRRTNLSSALRLFVLDDLKALDR
jgi:predicted DNA-binding ribbon-helix-helix protein